MTKISGGYESVVRGVSEQAPQNRRSGQHFAQVNMISDPVRGLSRRHGSVMQDEVKMSVTPDKYADVIADMARHKCYPFYVGGQEYDLIIRTGPDISNGAIDGLVYCFNKTTRKFIVVSYGGGLATSQLRQGGASAAVNVGRYMYIAGNTVTPYVATTNIWGDTDNLARIAATVQLGAYSRTFSLTLTRHDGSTITGEYTTPSSSYPGVLDTSDIPLYIGTELNKDYQKLVNDRVNAYNGEVTKWIGTAALGITPANIAAKIAEDLRAKGVSSAGNTGGTITIYDGAYKDAVGADGGDGSLIRAVGGNVDNIDLVNTFHWIGKVIKIPPTTTAGNAIYLKAVSRDGTATTGWGPVIWRETEGFRITPQTVFVMATVVNDILYMASSAADLSAITGLAVPNFKSNTVGDDLSSPVPEFFSRTIDYLGLFQDRLVIGAGATLMFSRPGDYLNWFRKSVSTVTDDDPWEGFALGTEDDTIKYSTIYDRNLLLFGKRFQYVVSGRQPFTPKTASIVVSTAFDDAVDAEPKATGNFVIYGKYSGRPGSEVASVHQVQAGAIVDSPESYNISQQLDTYLKGIPHEIVTLTAPNMVLVRTRSERNRVFTYSYLDDGQQGRLFDSWSCWEWSPHVGSIVGLSKDGGSVLIYTIKTRAGGMWIAAEQLVRDTVLSEYPYLDSLRPIGQFMAAPTTSYLNSINGPQENVFVAVDKSSPYSFLGAPITDGNDLAAQYPSAVSAMWAGVGYPAYVTPTNPYVRDRNGQVILTGRLTLTSVKVTVADTGGVEGLVVRNGNELRVLNFTGRILANPTNLLGRQPIVSTTLSVIVGGEVRECSYTLKAKTWLPLTIAAIEWSGQQFFNTRRA